LCLFASPSGKGSTHTNSLVGVTPRGENTDNIKEKMSSTDNMLIDFESGDMFGDLE
jgi:hypothetical protein